MAIPDNIRNELIEFAKEQKEWIISNSKKFIEMPGSILIEKNGEIIASIISPEVNRDMALGTARMAQAGFDPDYITFISDANYKVIEPNENETFQDLLNQYKQGDLQRLKEKGGKIHDCLQIVRVGRNGKEMDSISITYKYNEDKTSIVWDEPVNCDDLSGYVPDNLKETMSNPNFIEEISKDFNFQNIIKMYEKKSDEQIKFHLARAMISVFTEGGFLVNETITDKHRDWTDVKIKSLTALERMIKEGAVPKEAEKPLKEVIEKYSETTNYKEELIKLLKRNSFWLPSHLRNDIEETVEEFERLALSPAIITDKKNRVKVWNGDRSKYLGEGSHVGEAKVYFIKMPDGSIRSNKNAEEEPKDIPENGVLISKMNPKIILDSGEVVYGAQVWFEYCDETEVPKSKNNDVSGNKFKGKPKFNVAK